MTDNLSSGVAMDGMSNETTIDGLSSGVTMDNVSDGTVSEATMLWWLHQLVTVAAAKSIL